MKHKKGGMTVIVVCTLVVLTLFGICHSNNDSSDIATETISEQENATSTAKNDFNRITKETAASTEKLLTEPVIVYANIPEYNGMPYVELNGNHPYFEDTDLTTDSFEYYSDLDELGRCGVACANVCQELMPVEKRGEIGQIKPSGWHTEKYPNQIPDGYLYNRCHLIAYQLTGENTNEKNLITGTQYMNISGMVPFENAVADYVKDTNNHVLYRIAPIFEGDNLVASGVLMEAKSVEDEGNGVQFCVYCYNVQPGIEIDYATGDSQIVTGIQEVAASQTATNVEQTDTVTEYAVINSEITEASPEDTEASPETTEVITPEPETSADVYVWIPTNGGTKYHSNSNCSNMKNPEQVTLDNAIRTGFTACKKCY